MLNQYVNKHARQRGFVKPHDHCKLICLYRLVKRKIGRNICARLAWMRNGTALSVQQFNIFIGVELSKKPNRFPYRHYRLSDHINTMKVIYPVCLCNN